MSFHQFRRALVALMVVLQVTCNGGPPNGGVEIPDMHPGNGTVGSDKVSTSTTTAVLVEARVTAKAVGKFWWRVFCNVVLTIAMFLAFALTPGSIVGKGDVEKIVEGVGLLVVGLLLSVPSFPFGTSEVLTVALATAILPGLALLVWGIINDSENRKLLLLALPSVSGVVFGATLFQFAWKHFKLNPGLMIGLAAVHLGMLALMCWAWKKIKKTA
jgi:hypothetical protein